uniref:Putative secreted protein n=1 Tax=Anopheles darlingi TaxID=43151 RepID=A0A2M4DFJ7_ANODA
MAQVYFLPERIAWICALVLPFVSGTLMNTYTVQTAIQAPKNQKVQSEPSSSCMIPNDLVTRNTKVQLNMTASADARLLISGAHSSPIIIHGIGPKPSEKLMINSTTEASGSHPMFDTSTLSFWSLK